VQGSVSDVIKTAQQDSIHPSVTTQKHPVDTKYPSLINRNTQVTTDNKIHTIYTYVIMKIKKKLLTNHMLSIPLYSVLPIKPPYT
jgi:hypothetical protein